METKKRIYIGLLSASLAFAVVIIGLVWYLTSNRDIIISQILLLVIMTLAAVIFIILGAGITAIVVMIIRSRDMPSLENIAQLASETLFPLTLFMGKIFGIKKEKILRSYIEVNNYLVRSKQLLFPGNRIMILLPHCLQNSECPFKITMDINNCKECGKCKIGELKKFAEENQAIIKVATGGTLARKFIKEYRPNGVIAIACERDLSSGIQDIGVLPVIGVLNSRPNGPCINTDVDVDLVKEAFYTMCKGG